MAATARVVVVVFFTWVSGEVLRAAAFEAGDRAAAFRCLYASATSLLAADLTLIWDGDYDFLLTGSFLMTLDGVDSMELVANIC